MRIAGSQQMVPTRQAVFLDPSIVTGYDSIQPQRRHFVQQEGELDGLIAGNTGIGRTPVGILAGKVADDGSFKFFSHVEHVVPDVQPVGDRAGILDRGHSAARFERLVGPRPPARPQFHRQADALMPFSRQQPCGHRTVTPAAHRDGPLAHTLTSNYGTRDQGTMGPGMRILWNCHSILPATGFEKSGQRRRLDVRRSLGPLVPWSLGGVVLDAFPPRPQPAPDLGFESVLSRLVVDVTGHTVRQILLWNKSIWVVVRVLVAPTVTQLFHRLRMAGVSQVHRDRTGTLLLNIERGRSDGPDHCVALRSGGDVDGSFRHGNLRFL